MKQTKEFLKKASENIRHPQREMQERRERKQTSQQQQQAGTSSAPPQLQPPDSSQENTSNLPPGGSEIPQNLHFFWKGESPGREGQEWPHLQEWGNMGEKSAGWNKTLWTDSSSIDEWQKNHQDKLEELQKMNINVKPVEKEIDERNRDIYNDAVEYDARPMVSDVARYSVLKKHGGIYADLDIGPGNLSLPNYADQEGKEMLSSGKLPLMGPMVRDRKAVLDHTPKSEAPFKKRLKETIDKQYATGSFANNLIAAEPNNQTIDLMIDEVSTINDPEAPIPYKKNKSEFGEYTTLKTGPYMAARVMNKHMGLKPGPKQMPSSAPEATQYMNPKLKDRLINNIDLITDASNRDESEN